MGAVMGARSQAVLLEDIGETLDASLETVLTQAVYQQQGRRVIKVGEQVVEWNPAFRLYLTTKLPNPHYLPEVCIKVTLINFTVTQSGLEDQLLGLVVREERPQLEHEKNELIVSMAADRAALQGLEDDILRLLSSSSGNILDDEALVTTLSTSKATAAVIGRRVVAAEKTQRALATARASYLPAAARGSLLYFVTADLARLDPMYQFSLTYITRLFLQAVRQAAPSDDLDSRVANLMDHATLVVFENVARGLFEAHKATFAFLVASTILRSSGEVSELEWLSLLLGAAAGGGVGGAYSPSVPPPSALHLESAQWQLAHHLEASLPSYFGRLVSSLGTLKDDISGELAWAVWQRQPQPWLCPLPGDWDERVDERTGAPPPFARLLLTKLLRPEILLGAMEHVVGSTLGKRFAEREPLNLGAAFADATPRTPLIFVLTSGADPLGALLKFASAQGFADRLHSTSLGQGQGPVAEKMVDAGVAAGHWVLLQNCHLATSWMPRLERLVDGLSAGAYPLGVHDEFRLWLTSFPNLDFPVPVLQNAVKMTYEPPRGLKANLQATWAAMEGATLANRCAECPATWRKLLFGLTTLHALLQERRKFGALGFNIRYDFNETDLEISIATLAMLLEQQPKTAPWDALTYVTGHIHYGGRVTDEWDRRCVLSLLGSFYCDAALQEGYSFAPGAAAAAADGSEGSAGGAGSGSATPRKGASVPASPRDGAPPVPASSRAPSGSAEALAVTSHLATLARRYVAPPASELDGYRAYVAALPADDDVALFGLHQNAKITHGLAESASVLRTILNVQPRLASGGAAGQSAELTAAALAARLTSELPAPLERTEALRGALGRVSDDGKVDMGSLSSLQLVLLHELDHFNTLLRAVAGSLRDLQLAVNGTLLMSSELERMLASVLRGEVPSLWAKVAYPSLKPLSSWFADLQKRVGFIRSWLVGYGPPERFVLPYFFMQQSVLTGVLQMHARKHRTPVDYLSFDFTLLDEPDADAVAAAAAEARAEGASEAGFTPAPPPEDGILVVGLFLAGARYNRTRRRLQPPRPKEMATMLPTIHFLPVAHRVKDESDYECPLYKTSARAGTLSTTGASTNFVIAISVPTNESPDLWVRMGVAALCALDD